jgi:hypothetical protein
VAGDPRHAGLDREFRVAERPIVLGQGLEAPGGVRRLAAGRQDGDRRPDDLALHIGVGGVGERRRLVDAAGDVAAFDQAAEGGEAGPILGPLGPGVQARLVAEADDET